MKRTINADLIHGKNQIGNNCNSTYNKLTLALSEPKRSYESELLRGLGNEADTLRDEPLHMFQLLKIPPTLDNSLNN